MLNALANTEDTALHFAQTCASFIPPHWHGTSNFTKTEHSGV